MATTNLFSDPIFKDGAFTSNDPKLRACALQKTMNAIDLGVEFGAKIYVLVGWSMGDLYARAYVAQSTLRFQVNAPEKTPP